MNIQQTEVSNTVDFKVEKSVTNVSDLMSLEVEKEFFEVNQSADWCGITKI